MPRSTGPKKKPITRPALKTWVALNTYLMSTTNERSLEDLLRAELKGRARPVFVARIKSRLLKLHTKAQREQLEKMQ